MTRQHDLDQEVRESKRRDALVRALEFGIAGTLKTQGVDLVGFSANWDAWECLIVLKADIGGVRHVAFVGADNVITALLKASDAAQYDRLKWKEDVYKDSGV